jgi:hypothetical protein
MQGGRPKKCKMADQKNVRWPTKKRQGGRPKVNQKMQGGRPKKCKVDEQKNVRWPTQKVLLY